MIRREDVERRGLHTAWGVEAIGINRGEPPSRPDGRTRQPVVVHPQDEARVDHHCVLVKESDGLGIVTTEVLPLTLIREVLA